MMNRRWNAVFCWICLSSFVFGADAADGPAEPPLLHGVYFELKDASEQSIQAFVCSCQNKLSSMEGVEFFAVGRLAEDLNRPVNDRDFHVALWMVFENKRAHDRYQQHPAHLELIRANRASVKRFRVFNAYVQSPVRRSQ